MLDDAAHDPAVSGLPHTTPGIDIRFAGPSVVGVCRLVGIRLSYKIGEEKRVALHEVL
jgi:hypothetical protein